MPWPPVMPPMFFPPPPPRRGAGRGILMILLIVALVISIMINFGKFADLTGAAGIKQTTIVSGDSQTKIAVVPVDGLILDNSAAQFDQVLSDVEKDTTVKALVIEINTPGGSASASDEMYHRLLRFKKDRPIPVVIAMKGMATSGGYYLSCAGDYLFAEPVTLTGNIGVLLPRFNISKLVDEHGIEETTLVATTTGHSYKDAGSMFKPENPQDEQYLQGIVDGLFAQFKNAVETGRKGKLSDVTGDTFSGKAFLANDAKDRGLIDQIDYPEKAYDYAAQQAGVSNKSVVVFTPRTSILDMLSDSWRGGNPQGSASKMVSLNDFHVDIQSLQNLICAQPMMIWRGN
jgi:protease-4